MDRGGAGPVPVAHDDRDIVSRVHGDAVDQEPSVYRAPDAFPDYLEHGRRGLGVAADRAHVGLDDG